MATGGTPVEKSFNDNYKFMEKVGEGAYGMVYKGMNKNTEEVVAIKKIRLLEKEEGIPAFAIRECSMLKELRHPNIVNLIDVFFFEEKIYFILEYLKADLRTYMDLHEKMDSALIKSYTYQIFQALMFCHQRRVLHRDLKPHNLLINESGCIKIADFGLARAVNIPLRGYTPEVVTLWYRAPEILLNSSRYASPIDIWSVGTIFAEMINNTPIFQGDSEIDQLFRIFRILRTPTEELWPGVTQFNAFQTIFPKWTSMNLRSSLKEIEPAGADLLEQLFIYNPCQRITARQALLHPYFDDLDKNCLPAKPGMYNIDLTFE